MAEVSFSEEEWSDRTFHQSSCGSESTVCTIGNSPKYFEGRASAMELCYASVDGNITAMRNLLENGADVNFQDYSGQTALHIAAASESDSNVAKLLIEFGSMVNVADKMSRTPLDVALASGNVQVEEVLRENGAKIRQARLENEAIQGCWAIDRKDVVIQEKLGCTLKNKIFKGKWREIDVVVKFALEKRTTMARKHSKGSSQEGKQDCGTSAQQQYEELLHEISILQSLRHPDLVMFLGACLKDEPIMFLTEYMPRGDLDRYFRAKRKARQGLWQPPMHQILSWSKALCRALSFLHGCSKCIIHRDLKPLNLLLDQSLELKVTDFGISKLASGGTCSEYTKMTGGVGSLRYMAPEVVRHELYNEKADIYSAGLIFYFISSGRDPFHEVGKDPEKVLNQFLAGEEPRPTVSDCPGCLRGIMHDAWDQNINKRPSASTLYQQLSAIPAGNACCAIS